MESLELAFDLCDSTVQHIQQDGRTLFIDLDDTPAGAIRLIFEAATITDRTLDVDRLTELPAWHPVRRVTWAGVIAEYICFAMESGDRIWLQAQRVRLEQRR